MISVLTFIAALVASTPPVALPANSSVKTMLDERLISVTSLMKTQGGGCAGPAPRLMLDVVPSYGMYDDQENTLHITLWDALPAQARARYAAMVRARDAKAARSIYEEGTYKWVLVHELGHWWQHCVGKTHVSNYAREAGANRIAAAYWRGHNPKFMSDFAQIFASLQKGLPDPVPAGTDKEAYFNRNYDSLGRNPLAYIWYQAGMVVDAYAEKPVPSLQQALRHPADVVRQTGTSRGIGE